MSREHRRQRGGDRRRTFRCRIRDLRWDAALKVGWRKVPARVLNESAEGFAVVALRHPRVEAGDVVQLRTPSGWSEARVVYVKRDASAADGGTPGNRPKGPVRLGLKRLGDLPLPAERPGKIGWLLPAALWPSSFPTVVAGVLFVLIVVGIPTVAIALLCHFR